jgi:hypothetical protein
MAKTLEGSRNLEAHQKHATATADANTNAVLTVAAIAGQIHILDTLWFSYSGTPTGGRITIAIGGVTVLDQDITASGPGPLPLNRMNGGRENQAVVITLYAGGVGVIGKLSVQYW